MSSAMMLRAAAVSPASALLRSLPSTRVSLLRPCARLASSYTSSPSSFQSSSASSSGSGSAPPTVTELTVYGSFKVHKTKAAMDVAFNSPQVSLVQPRNAQLQPYYRLERQGSLRLEFAPAVEAAAAQPPASGRGRPYAWSDKQTVHLSVTEVGDLLAFHSQSAAAELRFLHDPALNSEQEGEVRKELLIRRQGGGKGFFFNCSINVKGAGKQVVQLPVSDGEWEVIAALCRSLLPQLLGMRQLPLRTQRDDSQSDQ